MKRRTFLATAAVVPLAAQVQASASQTKIQTLFKRWIELYHQRNAALERVAQLLEGETPAGITSSQFETSLLAKHHDHVADKLFAIDDQIRVHPNPSPDDMLIKLFLSFIANDLYQWEKTGEQIKTEVEAILGVTL
jgi:hypothetical protein